MSDLKFQEIQEKETKEAREKLQEKKKLKTNPSPKLISRPPISL